MCSNNATNVNMLPYGLRVPNPAPLLPLIGGMGQSPLDFHRAQVYDYSSRLNLQFALRGYPTMSPYHPMGNNADPFRHLYLYAKHDPRANFMHEEPKPSQSYIGLIAMAILSVSDKKMVLSDIYQYILDHYPYFRTRGPGWRNSIRHNLSLNDCFIKSGRSANGKGHYWAIHPANLEDFKKGDFRRRRAQRRVRKYLGLSVPDDEDSPSPSPSSTHQESWMQEKEGDASDLPKTEGKPADDNAVLVPNLSMTVPSITDHNGNRGPGAILENNTVRGVVQKTTGMKRRLFDMESLLAPDTDSPRAFKTFVATDLSIRREVREVRDDSDTEIVVADDRHSLDGDVSRQISVLSDSEQVNLDQSGSSKSEEENEVSSTDNDHQQSLNGLSLNFKSWSDNKTSPVDSEAGIPRVIKIHPSSPAVVTNGLGSVPFSHHPIPTPVQLAQQGLTWQDRPSAFQRMPNGNLSRTLSAAAYSPLLVQGRPVFPICLSTSDPVTSAQKWQETLSRIMARSYDKPVKTDS